MHPELKKYLDHMCREISNKTARENARLEIENHLLDQVEALVHQNLSEDEAISRVLKEATPPSKLGAKLNLAHRPFILRHPIKLFFSSVSVIALIAVISMSHIIVKDYFLPQLKAHFEPEFETKFQEDLEIIALADLPKVTTRNKNAYSFVMAKVGHENKKLSGHYDEIEKLMIKWDAQDKGSGGRSRWTKKHLVERLMKHESFKTLDVSWVDDLSRYDHLNYFSSPENESIFQDAQGKSGMKRIFAISSYKVPDFNLLRKAITYRAYQKIDQGKPDEAQKILLHSFMLFQSSGALIGNNLAALTLKSYERMRSSSELNWQEIPRRTRLAYRRIGWGWSSIMIRSVLDPDSFSRWEKYAKPELGVCSGVTEAQGSNAFYSDFFLEKAPLETDLGDLVSKTRTLISKINHLCGLTQLAKLQESEILEKDSFFDSGYVEGFYYEPESLISKIPLNPSRIPYVRRVFGMFLMTVSIPQFHNVYLMKDDPEV